MPSCSALVIHSGLILVWVLGGPGPAVAQAGNAGGAWEAETARVPEKAGKVVRAYRLRGPAPTIDGRLDDSVWAEADSLDDFVQEEPDNGLPLSERTVVQIAYDDRYLYVAVRCDDREPARIATGLGRRDNFPPSDFIYIGFDPRHDHLTGNVFQTNPSGVQGDLTFFDDQGTDRQYDAVWEVRTGRNDDGWTAEFRIPLSQMRFTGSSGTQTVWGLGVRRTIYRKGEAGDWVGRPRGTPGNVSRWGHLLFDQGVSAPPRVEVLPFTLARRADLAGSGVEHSADAGVDARIGLGSAATLSATVNPDFGQVELDPAVLNLSVFESFFPEKRPFFQEDGRTFVPPYGLFQMFHSRRIGRRPGRIAVGATDFVVDRPDQTTILGATKVTGKSSGWTYGALTALTARENATVDSIFTDSAGVQTATRLQRLIEPLTAYSAARIQRNILGGSSNVGLLATAVVRERDFDALAGGIDYKLRWGRNRYEWNGHWVLTHAPGAGGVRTGFGGVTNVSYSGKYVGVYSHFDHFGADFRINDLGFLRTRSDRTAFGLTLNLAQPDPWSVFRSVSGWIEGGQSWNGDRLVFERYADAGFFAELRNYWNFNVGAGRSFQVFDDLDTRGGPPIVRPANTFWFLNLNSDRRKTWRVGLNGSGGWDAAGGWSWRLGPRVSVQPSPRLQASLSTNYGRGRDDAQWITNGDVDGDGATDYVYGTLQRDVLDVTARTTYALNRDLSLELYLQPFVAVGAYANTRKLAQPSSYTFAPVTLPYSPDFNSKSLRGNVVLRWEYVGGSTLFVVWNLSTFDGSRAGSFSPWRDLGTAFGADGDAIFMVKANYWLSL